MRYLLLSLLLLSCSKINLSINKGHTCNYIHCPFPQGTQIFTTGCEDCFRGDECWSLDSIHFIHPQLNYDSCDSILNNKL